MICCVQWCWDRPVHQPLGSSPALCSNNNNNNNQYNNNNNVLQPFVQDYPVSQYQKKHSPIRTYPDHQPSFISFLHLLRSIASSLSIYLFNYRACMEWHKQTDRNKVTDVIDQPVHQSLCNSPAFCSCSCSSSSFINPCNQETELHVTVQYIWMCAQNTVYKKYT